MYDGRIVKLNDEEKEKDNKKYSKYMMEKIMQVKLSDEKNGVKLNDG